MHNTKVSWTPEALRALTYDAEQKAAIAQALGESATQDENLVRHCWSSDLIARNPVQTFAIFGAIARQLIPFADAVDEGGTRFEYLPVVVEGRMYEATPEEGRAGVLYLMRKTHRIGGIPDNAPWISAYLNFGWLWTKELDMPAQAIAEQLEREIQAGENVLTQRPPGWA